MSKAKSYTAAELADIRFRYEETPEPLWSIARRHNMDERTLNRLVRRQGWRMRAPSRAHDLVQPAAAKPALVADAAETAAIPAPAEDIPLAERVQRMVEQELATVDRVLARLGPAPGHPGAAERSARTLASLVKTLNELRRLKAAETPAAGEPDAEDPRDYDQLRRELAHRMERLVAEQSHPLPDGE
jgi:aminoglycoside phosphotransferase (APT) family kinase protein